MRSVQPVFVFVFAMLLLAAIASSIFSSSAGFIGAGSVRVSSTGNLIPTEVQANTASEGSSPIIATNLEETKAELVPAEIKDEIPEIVPQEESFVKYDAVNFADNVSNIHSMPLMPVLDKEIKNTLSTTEREKQSILQEFKSYIVLLKPGVTIKMVSNRAMTSNESLQKDLDTLHASVVPLVPNPNHPLARLMKVINRASMPDNVALRLLRENNQIEKAEINRIAFTQATLGPPVAKAPAATGNDDPLFAQQYHHVNIGSADAWQTQKGSPSTIIAIVDTGVDWHHEDLGENIWHNGGEIPNNGIDDEGNGFIDDVIGWDFVNTAYYCTDIDCATEDNDPSDHFGHGTHVAGIAAAKGFNGKGISGVCPNCTIMPLRAGYTEGSGGSLEYADTIQAITYAADNGADIINMSYGGSYDDFGQKMALDYAASKGVILVASAGNNASDSPSYPAGYENVISVAATDQSDFRAYFSNYGTRVDVAAPGYQILSTVSSNTIMSGYCAHVAGYSEYAECSGTSMASPVVAGIVGLLRSQNPSASSNAIRTALQSGVDEYELTTYHPDKYIGNGRVSSKGSVNWIIAHPSAEVLFNESSFEGMHQGTISLKGTVVDPASTNAQVQVESKLYQNPILPIPTFSFTPPVNNAPLGNLETETLTNGKYMVRMTAHDSSNGVTGWIQKPLDVQNITITSPVPQTTINANAPVSFIGKIVGPHITKYEFSWGGGNTPITSNGITYPNGNTTEHPTEQVLAVWNPPSDLDEKTILVQVNVTYSLSSGNITKTITFDYYPDSTLAPGWPANMDATIDYYHEVSDWENAGATGDNRIISVGQVHDDFGYYFPRIYSFDSDGTTTQGWPVNIPLSFDLGGITYYYTLFSGYTPIIADIDADGKTDLLYNAQYTQSGLSNEYVLQDVVFAYNPDGTIKKGFPLVSHHPSIQDASWSGGATQSNMIVSDVDDDGFNEIIVYTQYVQKTNSEVWISRFDLTGFTGPAGVPQYSFTPIIIPLKPAPYIYWYYNSYAPLAIGNVDADPDKEIAVMGPLNFTNSPSSGFAELFLINPDGTPLPGWPATIDTAGDTSLYDAPFTITMGTIGNTKAVVAMVRTWHPSEELNVKVFAFGMDGKELPGYPKQLSGYAPFFSLQSPIFEDVDGDGANELITMSQDYTDYTTRAFAYNETGNLLPGWPKTESFQGGYMGLSPITTTIQQQPAVLSTDYFPYDPAEILQVDHAKPTITPLSIFPNHSFSVSAPAVVSLFTNGKETSHLAEVHTISLSNVTFDSLNQILVHDTPASIQKGNWYQYMRNDLRENAAMENPLKCDHVTNGQVLTTDTTICPGTASLPDGIIVQTSNAPITIQCVNSVIAGTSKSNSVGITVTNTTNTPQNVVINGCAVNSYGVGIGVVKPNNVTLTNNVIGNVVRGINVWPLPSTPAGSFLFQNNLITTASLMGISLAYASNAQIIGNTFGKMGISEAAIVVGDTSKFVHIEKNTIGGENDTYSTGILVNASDAQVISNTILGKPGTAITLWNAPDTVVQKNIITGPEQGITADSSNKIQLIDNDISVGSLGMYILHSHNAVFHYNHVIAPASAGTGVYIDASKNASFIQNEITNFFTNVQVKSGSAGWYAKWNNLYKSNAFGSKNAKDAMGIENTWTHNYYSDWGGSGNYVIDSDSKDKNPASAPNVIP